MTDFYHILGVSPTASDDEIKKAYRRLAKQHHPDVNKGNASSEERFKGISEAYNTLSDPEKRKQYDMMRQFGGAQGFPGGGQGFPGGGGFHWEGNFPGGAPNDLGDIFSELFGMGGVNRDRAGWGGRRGTARPAPAKGEDRDAPLEIEFIEAVTGCSKTISLRQGGDTERLTVKIPAGVDNGSRVRMAGKGGAGEHGGPAGDLYLNISVKPHARFWREGADVYLDLPVTIYDAILGATVEVPTIEGTAKMKIPAGTPSGKKFRLKGKGAPILGKRGTGDLYAIIQIIPPSDIPSSLRKQFEELQNEHPYKVDR